MKKTSLPRYHKSGYVSEYEQFLNQFKAEHPYVEPDQRRGWEIWWHRRPVQDEMAIRRATDGLENGATEK